MLVKLKLGGISIEVLEEDAPRYIQAGYKVETPAETVSTETPAKSEESKAAPKAAKAPGKAKVEKGGKS